MIKTLYKITSEKGLHARPATVLVNEASKYTCSIKLTVGSVKVDMKSIMGVMSTGVYKDQVIEISFDGIDEQLANANMFTLINDLKIAVEL